MDLITPQLIIGSRDDAAHPELLHRFNIDAVLSLEPVRIIKPVACQLILKVQDRIALPEVVIAQAADFIQQQIAQGRNVLVHCQMGISRSPALVLAYLHQYQGLSLRQALLQIQRVRPQAKPHPALLTSIQRHYQLATLDQPAVDQYYPAQKQAVTQALAS